MDDSGNILFRFFMTGVVGMGATVRPPIAAQQSLLQLGTISHREYARRVANLVSDKFVYAQLKSYYQLQAAGWAMTFLAAALYL